MTNKFGGREPVNGSRAKQGTLELNAFNLFCTYHLGITADGGYKKPQVRDVARRFSRSVDEIHDALRSCGLDNASLKKSRYNMSYAQLDVRVAPEGIDKVEIAKGLYEELKEDHSGFVEWTEPVQEPELEEESTVEDVDDVQELHAEAPETDIYDEAFDPLDDYRDADLYEFDDPMYDDAEAQA